MNMKKISILFAILFFFISAESFSQNTLKKWYISAGVHAVNHPSARGWGEGLFKGDNWSFVPPISQITIARTLNHSFALDFQASIGEIDNKRLMMNNEFMALVGLGLRYRFANGYILKETSWFDPYLRAGANYHRMPYRGLEFAPAVYDASGNMISGVVDASGDVLENGAVAMDDHFAVSAGIGSNFWIWRGILGINIEALYVSVPDIKSDYIDFFQAKAGIAYRFGKIDRDGDGIPDDEDECPDTPGLAEFNGCPDTDGDGIEDRLDECPLDPCPNGEETDEYYCINGCKVMKEVPEEVEPEPEVVEPEPEEPGPIITFDDVDVMFDFDSSRLKAGASQKIKEAAEIINEMEGDFFIVEGHTDSTGDATYNQGLSERRAQSVMDALVKEGVSKDRLEAKGYGLTQPKCTNDTKEGRACNRRVEIIKK